MIDKAIFQALVFLFPSQLALHFWPNWALIFGIRVDYFAPTIYLTDLLVLTLFIIWLLRKPKLSKRGVMYGMFLLLLAVLNIFFSQNVLISLFRWLKVGEMLFLGYYLATNKNIKVQEWIIKPLIYSSVLFSLIGVTQFIIQRTIGGVFYYLGERSFTVATPGIALVEILGRNYLRSYSTFSHPNSFGAYLSIVFVFILGEVKNSWKKYLTLFLVSIGILLSFSLGVYLSLILAYLGYWLMKRIKIKTPVIFITLITGLSLILPFLSQSFLMKSFVNNESIMRRLALSEISIKLVLERPIFGVGLNNFILKSSQQSLYPTVSWWLQPVHNIYLLALTETGVVGFLVFAFLIFKAFKNSFNNRILVISLLIILITSMVDHYWLTLQQNLLLLTTVFGLSFKGWKNN